MALAFLVRLRLPDGERPGPVRPVQLHVLPIERGELGNPQQRVGAGQDEGGIPQPGHGPAAIGGASAAARSAARQSSPSTCPRPIPLPARLRPASEGGRRGGRQGAIFSVHRVPFRVCFPVFMSDNVGHGTGGWGCDVPCSGFIPFFPLRSAFVEN